MVKTTETVETTQEGDSYVLILEVNSDRRLTRGIDGGVIAHASIRYGHILRYVGKEYSEDAVERLTKRAALMAPDFIHEVKEHRSPVLDTGDWK